MFGIAFMDIQEKKIKFMFIIHLPHYPVYR